MARCRVAMEKLPPYRNAVLYRVLDDIDYVIPSFEVLRVRLHRCIFAVIQDDGSEGELIEGFICNYSRSDLAQSDSSVGEL